jgi:signal transduction histidine kinase
MKQHSIARRLITTVLLVELVAALSVTAIAFLYERHSHFRSFDIMLRGRADSVLGAVQDAEDPGDHIMLDKADLNLPGRDIYEVRDEFGQLLGRSSNWTGPDSKVFASKADQFLTLSVQGKAYRTILLHGLRVVDPDDKGGGTPRHFIILYGSPTGHVWESVMEAVNFYAVFSVVLLAVTGIVMAWLLNRSMAPLRELATQAVGVSADSWEFHPSEEVQATKELAPLAHALQNLLHGLERSFLQERRFVSDAAHELKTAVAVVKSSLQLLSMKQRTAAEYEAGLERCQADCERMEEIVAKMLTLARIEHSPSTQDRTACSTDIAAHLRQVVDQLQPMAEIGNLQIALSAPESLRVALTTEECDLLCSNLLLNAVQHSKPETRIAAYVEQHGEAVEFRIEDQGDGIDPSVLPHVFERFYRGDPSRNRKTGGTGLGLAICKAIVDAAHGEIKIQSQPGAGTTVIVRLPLAANVKNSAAKESIELATLPSA